MTSPSLDFKQLIPDTWYKLTHPTNGSSHVVRYEEPHTEKDEYIFKDRHGYRWRYTPDYHVAGPVPEDPLTPIELEIQRYKERGYPQDEDSAPGYLRPKDLVVGEWYQVENYGGGHSFKGKYTGPSEYSDSSYFVCKYGATNVIPTHSIKPVDRMAHWYVSGPIPEDTMTAAEIRARKEMDARYESYVTPHPSWKR